MRMSDLIEEFIKELFEENEYIEIQRNDLAEQFNCVPSQINYVIATRFKPSQGYYVESRRGGGGHIRIQKIDVSKTNYITHIIKNIGEQLTNQEVEILISDLLSYNLITEKEAKLLKVATSDNILITAKEVKDVLRAKLLKNMLLNIL
ncbi:MAG: CtsR family transcriptional regulator [Clostridia bacterium]|nr:CtsR family transcriptional regulator [Clostridia bacterium]